MELIDYQTLSDLIERTAGCGVRIHFLDTGTYRATRGFWSIIGAVPIEGATKRDVLEPLVSPADQHEYRRSDLTVNLEFNYPINVSFRVIRPDKTTKYLNCRSEILFDQTGREVAVISIYMDVTDRNLLARRLDRNDQIESALVHYIQSAVWTISANGQTFDSLSWCQLTGQSGDEAQGTGWLEAIHPEDRQGLQQIWSDALKAIRPCTARFRVRRANGTYRWFLARSAPLVLPDGSIKEWVGAGIDIDDIDPQEAAALAAPMVLGGAHIRAARGAINWSSRELAEAAGISPAMLRTVEETRANPADDPKIAASASSASRMARWRSSFRPRRGPILQSSLSTAR